jgi:integrase
MLRFTELYIRALQPQKTRYEIREGDGFAIRISPNGIKTWVFIYKFQNRKRRMTLGNYPGMTLSKARAAFREARNLLEQGKDPIEAKRREREEQLLRDEARRRELEAPTVARLVDEYLEKWAKPRKRSWREDQRILEKDIIPAWGKRKAKDITRRDVITLLDKLVDRGAPIQANRTLACVRKMFNFAVSRDIVPISPCTQITAPSAENRRDRVLSAGEIRLFWQKLDAAPMAMVTRLALKLILVTGQRKGEVINAEWSEVNLNSAWWTIPAEKSKNKLAHRVPLSPLAIALLEEAQALAGDSRWVFPGRKIENPIRGDSVNEALARSLPCLEIEDQFVPHDLRRTMASHLTGMGISRLVVSKLLNHVETGITAVYDRHSYDDEKRRALEAWGIRLQEIISNMEIPANVVGFYQSG